MDIPAINGLFDKVLAKGRRTLTEVEGYDVFTLCGIRTPAYRVFTRGNDAADFVAKQLERGAKKFVAKVVSPDVAAGARLNRRSSTRRTWAAWR